MGKKMHFTSLPRVFESSSFKTLLIYKKFKMNKKKKYIKLKEIQLEGSQTSAFVHSSVDVQLSERWKKAH